jgi:hypothetical protein
VERGFVGEFGWKLCVAEDEKFLVCAGGAAEQNSAARNEAVVDAKWKPHEKERR